MKPFDKKDNFSAKSVPEMIQTLWELYMDVSADPALTTSACHIRSAALALEKIRQVAMQVSIEQTRQPARRASKKSKLSAREQERLEWLRTARTASPSKH
jgi:hypothetical protein